MMKRLLLIVLLGCLGVVFYQSVQAMGGGWVTDIDTYDKVNKVCRDGYQLTHAPAQEQTPTNGIKPLSFGHFVDDAWFSQEVGGIIQAGLGEPLLYSNYYQTLGPTLALDSYAELVEESIEVPGSDPDHYFLGNYPFSRHLPVGTHVAFRESIEQRIFDIALVEDCYFHVLPGDIDQQIDTRKFINPGDSTIDSSDLTVEILEVPEGGSITFGLDDVTPGYSFRLSLTELWGMNYVAGANPPAEDQLKFAVRGTYRVSLDEDGEQITSGASYDPSISADGSAISFTSLGDNLVSDMNMGEDVDQNQDEDIYIRALPDFGPWETKLVSHNDDGTGAGNGRSYNSDISPDGKLVTYVSAASDLVGGSDQCDKKSDLNNVRDIFKWDITSFSDAANSRVSMFNFPNGTGCNEINARSLSPAVADSRSSGNSELVAFQTLDDFPNLVYSSDNNASDILLDNDGTTTRLYIANDALSLIAPNGRSYAADISADGKFVAFTSDASNLFDSDTNGHADVGIKDLNGDLSRISVASDGSRAVGGDSTNPAISQFGQHIAFESRATNLSPAEYDTNSQIYVHDTATGCTQLLTKSISSLLRDGSMANGASIRPQISANGRFVAFASSAANLVSNDTNDVSDIFLIDRDFDQDHSFYAEEGSCEPGPFHITRVSIAGDGTEANDASFDPAISDNGDFVAFASDATNLISGDTNGLRDVFVHYIGYTGEIRFESESNEPTPTVTPTATPIPTVSPPAASKFIYLPYASR